MSKSSSTTTAKACSDLDLDALETLEKAASLQSWIADMGQPGRAWVLANHTKNPGALQAVAGCIDRPGCDAHANAALIAAARNALPELIRLARRAARLETAAREHIARFDAASYSAYTGGVGEIYGSCDALRAALAKEAK